MAGQTTNYLFDYPTSTDYVKDGATAIQTLATDVDTTLFTALGGAYPGLRLVKKQTIGSGVTSVAVTGAFSATYDNYLIIVSGGVSSSGTGIDMILGATATGYYRGANYTAYSSATVVGVASQNAASWVGVGYATANVIDAKVELFDPFLAKNTKMRSSYVETATAGISFMQQGYVANTTSYTGFTLSTSGGVTLTGGTIYIYGYGAS